MQNKVISVTDWHHDSIFNGDFEIVHVSWNEPSPKGHVTIADESGRILAIVSHRHPSIHFPEPLKAKHLRFSGLDSGLIQVYSRGTSSSGH